MIVAQIEEDLMAGQQTFENHARTIPGYHIVTFGILAVNFLWHGYQLVTGFSGDRLVSLLVAIALLLLFFYARIFALTVQDRVIRLEMRLRLREVLPDSLRPRISEFTTPQLIALRFASDTELPDLCRKVLDERIGDKKVIKRMIRNWQEDVLRA
jgi:hypothetical protein